MGALTNIYCLDSLLYSTLNELMYQVPNQGRNKITLDIGIIH